MAFIITTQPLLYSSTHRYIAAHCCMLLYTAAYCYMLHTQQDKNRQLQTQQGKEKEKNAGVT
jgi:hypothetical protein